MSRLLLPFVLSCVALSARAAGLASVAEGMREPGPEYSSGPLWVWNDLLTADQLEPFFHVQPAGIMVASEDLSAAFLEHPDRIDQADRPARHMMS